MPLPDLLFTMLWIYVLFLWTWLAVSVFIDIFRSPDGGPQAPCRESR